MYKGCNFWYWKKEYIDLLILRNLLDVRALLTRINAINESKEETKVEATSTSSKLKKKDVFFFSNTRKHAYHSIKEEAAKKPDARPFGQYNANHED